MKELRDEIFIKPTEPIRVIDFVQLVKRMREQQANRKGWHSTNEIELMVDRSVRQLEWQLTQQKPILTP